jgi:hypothetical protein
MENGGKLATTFKGVPGTNAAIRRVTRPPKAPSYGCNADTNRIGSEGGQAHQDVLLHAHRAGDPCVCVLLWHGLNRSSLPSIDIHRLASPLKKLLSHGHLPQDGYELESTRPPCSRRLASLLEKGIIAPSERVNRPGIVSRGLLGEIPCTPPFLGPKFRHGNNAQPFWGIEICRWNVEKRSI